MSRAAHRAESTSSENFRAFVARMQAADENCPFWMTADQQRRRRRHRRGNKKVALATYMLHTFWSLPGLLVVLGFRMRTRRSVLCTQNGCNKHHRWQGLSVFSEPTESIRSDERIVEYMLIFQSGKLAVTNGGKPTAINSYSSFEIFFSRWKKFLPLSKFGFNCLEKLKY